MSKRSEELPVPPAVASATRAMEMVRIWLIDGEQQVVISSNLWKDPAAWGLMLVDLANHVAAAYGEQGHDRAATLQRILDGFQAEMDHPTA